MDLGIAGRKAIVCASSRGLGRACAKALAAAGCAVVINGRNGEQLAATAAELRQATGGTIIPVVADVASADGQAALFAACPEPDILVNNNAGPPARDFRELDRAKMLDGVVANMIVAVELIQRAIEPMVARKFGRIVSITSGSVKMPLAGLDLSSGARAGLTAFLAGVARSVAASNVTINFFVARRFRHRPPALLPRDHGQGERRQPRRGAGRTCRRHSGATRRRSRGVRRGLRLPLLGAGRLYHRPESSDRRRRLSGRVLEREQLRATDGGRLDFAAVLP
jgi:3-oxoacyl-[acyl-carrier protein] reductase